MYYCSAEDCCESINLEQISLTGEYALNKLLQDAAEENTSDCSFRVFYRAGALDPSHVLTAMEKIVDKYSVTFSILPVVALRQKSTVLSFCAVRHQ